MSYLTDEEITFVIGFTFIKSRVELARGIEKLTYIPVLKNFNIILLRNN